GRTLSYLLRQFFFPQRAGIFSGTFATGELADSKMLDLMDCPLANITPSNCAAKKTSKAK
ncbi:hypothetical protein VP01_9404g1, partial [Puccinia sorghi]